MDARLVLIIESDPNAMAQMRRVLAGMGLRAVAVSDEDALRETTASLLRAGTPPALIIARVALPSGSGIRMLDETAAQFPDSRHMLISHHPRRLLMSVPGFAPHVTKLLQAEFRDDQFRAAIARALVDGHIAREPLSDDQLSG